MMENNLIQIQLDLIVVNPKIAFIFFKEDFYKQSFLSPTIKESTVNKSTLKTKRYSCYDRQLNKKERNSF